MAISTRKSYSRRRIFAIVVDAFLKKEDYIVFLQNKEKFVTSRFRVVIVYQPNLIYSLVYAPARISKLR